MSYRSQQDGEAHRVHEATGKKNIIDVSYPHERFVGDLRQHCFFKATHEKAGHTWCHFGAHTSAKYLLEVSAVEGEIVVSKNNVHEVTESIQLLIGELVLEK